jgi:hypothetical protein
MPSTPAPWRNLGPSGPGFLVGAAAGGICWVFGPHINPYAHADVALIAASPELRDALKALLPIVGGVLSELKSTISHTDGTVSFLEKLHGNGVAALKKAEGWMP